ncbi:hypothetical protein VTL71DRAFT_2208 [Oculimacula yallundae]|uniref:Heterokaryon incompatibility domain-containing protein n=1 Tax=Oculimacula yallundae TaxID=86028 RepID=A0ABR4C9F0_9HELO
MEAYKYTRLQRPTSFRLMQLHGSNVWTEVLRLELVEVSADQHPPYEAISYTWDGQKPTQSIICRDAHMLVTRNSEAALRHLRPRSNDKHRLLWMDSICIDQDTEVDAMTERQTQVAMMGVIYRAAEQVLIWLGDGSDTLWRSFGAESFQVSTTFDWLSRISTLAANEAMQHVEGGDQVLLTLASEMKVSHLFEVFRVIPWFKRIWVVQEAALSKIAVLIYGDTMIPFDSILRARHRLSSLSTSSLQASVLTGALNTGFDIHDRATRCLSSSSFTAVDIMLEARFSHASQSKDKVFALYGLFAALKLSLPEPDYSKTEAQIFRETTIAIIERYCSLDVLEQVHGLGAPEGLVSWAPNWASKKHAFHPIIRHNVTRSSPPIFSFSNDKKTLIVRGTTVDGIVKVAGVALVHCHEGMGIPADYFVWSHNAQPELEFWRTMLESWPQHSESILPLWNLLVLRELCEFAKQSLLGEKEEQEFLFELFSTILSREPSWNAQKDFKLMRKWWAIISGQQPATTLDSEESLPENTWMTPTVQKIRANAELAPLLNTSEFRIFETISTSSKFSKIHEHTAYQTLFRTKSGRLGMAPHPIKVGDEIALFSGRRLPMVLRPQQNDSEFRLITPAYVHDRIVDHSKKTKDPQDTALALRSRTKVTQRIHSDFKHITYRTDWEYQWE